VDRRGGQKFWWKVEVLVDARNLIRIGNFGFCGGDPGGLSRHLSFVDRCSSRLLIWLADSFYP
jgi:hypothetical protein